MLQKKICMLGSFSVGKTSLVPGFVESIFFDVYQPPIGVKFDRKFVRVNNEDVTLVLWDIHGEDVYQKIHMSYLRGMSGYLLVIDGTRRQTLEDALALNQRVTQEVAKVPAILVLNKSDLVDEWEIDSARESELAAAGWTILRTSAKTGASVEQVFSQLAAATLAE